MECTCFEGKMFVKDTLNGFDYSMCVSTVTHRQPVPAALTMHAEKVSSDAEENKWV